MIEHDYAAASATLTDMLICNCDVRSLTPEYKAGVEAIRHALKIADGLQKGPTPEMEKAMAGIPGGELVARGIFNAMISEFLKEIEK